jgi:hypothetical protein
MIENNGIIMANATIPTIKPTAKVEAGSIKSAALLTACSTSFS